MIPGTSIKAIDSTSVHRITSGQVVIDLQTAVKELVENSLDAGANSIDVRFKDYGLKSIEVIDNGHGIAPEDYDNIALKHHTSKLASFEDLATVLTFGFRGEALSSLCALSSAVTVTTATADQAPMGTVLEFDRSGKVKNRSGKVAKQRGTTVMISGLFTPLPVRRKEFERNAKREYGKALTLLHAYALGPCTQENRGVRLTVSNHPDKGARSVQVRTDGTPSSRASVSALWGPKSLENVVPLDLQIEVEAERSSVLKKRGVQQDGTTSVEVKGLISKFTPGCGRTSTDRQFFYVNGRPCNLSKVQKAFNEVYRTFNTNQAPFVIANFQLPTSACDINVSPDKRTIFIHSENSLVQALKVGLEEAFSPSRSTFSINGAASKATEKPNLRRSDSDRDSSRDDKDLPPQNLSEQEEDDEEAPGNAEDPNEDRGTSSKRHHWRRDEKATTNEPTEKVKVQGRTIKPAEARPLTSRSQSIGVAEPIAVRNDRDDRDDAEERHGEDEEVNMDDSNEDIAQISVAHGSHTSDISMLFELDEDVAHQDVSDPDIEPDHDTSVASVNPSSLSHPPLFLPSPSSSPSPQAPPSLNMESSSSIISRSRDHPPPPLYGSSGLDQREERPRKRARTSSPSPALASLPEKSHPVQMVLGTAGAAWSLKVQRGRGDQVIEAREVKKTKASAGASTSARDKIRSRLTGFMAPGSQIKPIQVDDDDDEVEEDEAKEMDGVEPQQTSLQDMNVEPSLDESVQPGPSDAAPTSRAKKSVIDLTTSLVYEDDDISGLVQQGFEEPTGEAWPRPEIVRTIASDTTIRIDLDRLSSTWSHFRPGSSVIPSTPSSQGLHASANVANAEDAEGAERELARVIHKEDFTSMHILGQFNLGFIITRRVIPEDSVPGKRGADDLFIVDQHAADEKYNFETLQQTTKIESQKLFQPRPLELTAADELVAMENVDVLRNNGFEVVIDEDAPAGQRERIRLVAQPVSKGTTFDMKDLEELLHLMQDQPTGQMVRCTKARAMFAMRACRKSVMVGMPLTMGQMTSVVRHMGTMDQPWNCPHGRPTMRHLASLSALARNDSERRNRSVDWSKFVVDT